MRYAIAVSGALLIGWSAFSSPAQAQTMCGERRAVVQNLEQTYSEAPVSIGLASNGAVIRTVPPEFFRCPRAMRLHRSPMLLKVRAIRLDRSGGAGVVAASPVCTPKRV